MLRGLVLALLALASLPAQAQEHSPGVDTVDPGDIPALEEAASPETILEGYPLGLIDAEAVLARHGQPTERVVLANGQPGWVYRLEGGGETQAPERYTIVLGRTGGVLDVLYQGGGQRLSALQLQGARAR